MMKIIFVLNILILLFMSPLLGQPNKTITIKVIETTDVHGAFMPFDQIENRPVKTSLAQVYSYVKQERNKKDQQVILLDNGDILQGQPAVYYSNYEKINQPHICAQIMNFMKYDAGSVGNHDIEAGHNVYDKVAKEFKHPWMAANCLDKKTGKPYFKPYHIIKKGNIKIAVLGLITPAIPTWLPENLWSGLEFEDMIESARKWVAFIQKNEKPDVLIGLMHAGYDFTFDKQDENTFKNENASMLVAQKVSGFDAVLIGHDHSELIKTVKNADGNDVLFMDAKNNAQKIGVVTIQLTLDPSTKKYSKKLSAELISTENFKADEEFTQKFNPFFDEVKKYVDKPVGTFKIGASSQKSFFGNSEFVDFVHKVQMELTNADLSFAAPLSFSVNIDSGLIFVRDLFKLYKFENMLYMMKLTGQEIKDYLEFSANLWFNSMKNEEDNLLLFRKEANGTLSLSKNGNAQLVNPFYNFESASGINYTVDVSKPIGNRVRIDGFTNGNLFELTKIYKVALNSYRGSGGGGHLTIGSKIPREKLAERVIYSTDKDLRYFMMQWIKSQVIVTPPTNNNWNIMPKDWVEKAKIRDMELLFGKNKK